MSKNTYTVLRCEKCGFYMKYNEQKKMKCKNVNCNNIIDYEPEKTKLITNCLKSKLINLSLWADEE